MMGASQSGAIKQEEQISSGRKRRTRTTSTDADAEVMCLEDVTNVSQASVQVKAEPDSKRRKATITDKDATLDATQFRLLEQLRYGKVIKKIAEIRKLTKEGMKKFGAEMVLPRIVVIGNESSGKSSTLERIAGQPVLPCDTGICTRAPVVLELMYDPEAVEAQIFFKGFSGDYEKMKDAEAARRKVMDAMESLKGVGIAADKEVRVKIVSNDVPTLELVDLPGLVLSRNNCGEHKEPENMTQLTIDCTKKYVGSADTGVVLCIVAASEPNLRTVKALGILQECPNYEKLKHTAIGVFAQSDKMFDANYEDEGRCGPRWRLEERLRGTSDDQVQIEHGFVAVKNRNSRSQKGKTEDLTGCWSNEKAWFESEAAFRSANADNKQVAKELSDRLGLGALLQKIDKVFCKHLNDHWVPQEVAAIDKEQNEFKVQFGKIAECMRHLQTTELLEHIEMRLLNQVFTDPALESESKAFVVQQFAGKINMNNNSLLARVREVRESSRVAVDCSHAAPKHFISLFESKMTAEFERAPNAGEIDLKVYRAQWKIVLAAFKTFVESRARALSAWTKDLLRLDKPGLLTVPCGGAWNETLVQSLVRSVILEHLLMPAVEDETGKKCLSWLSPCADEFKLGASHFMAERLQLEGKMKACDEVKKSLTDLLQC